MDDQFKGNNPGSGTGPGFGEGGAGTAARMKEDLSNKASEAKNKIADFGRQTVDRIDAQRQPVADTINKTASTLHQQGDNAATAVHKTANKMEATAEYLREHDLKAMMSDVQELAKRYPGQSLMAAVAVGFLVGRMFSPRE